MTLTEICRDLVRRSGRTDLVGRKTVDSHLEPDYTVDNGAVGFVNEGVRFVCDRAPWLSPRTVYTRSLQAGQFQFVCPNLKSADQVILTDATTKQRVAPSVSQIDVCDEYMTRFSLVDRGPPKWWMQSPEVVISPLCECLVDSDFSDIRQWGWYCFSQVPECLTNPELNEPGSEWDLGHGWVWDLELHAMTHVAGEDHTEPLSQWVNHMAIPVLVGHCYHVQIDAEVKCGSYDVRLGSTVSHKVTGAAGFFVVCPFACPGLSIVPSKDLVATFNSISVKDTTWEYHIGQNTVHGALHSVAANGWVFTRIDGVFPVHHADRFTVTVVVTETHGVLIINNELVEPTHSGEPSTYEVEISAPDGIVWIHGSSYVGSIDSVSVKFVEDTIERLANNGEWNILLAPPPLTAYTVTVLGLFYPDNLENPADENFLTTHYSELVLLAALYKVACSLQAGGSSDERLADFERALDERRRDRIRGDLRRLQRPDGSIVMKGWRP